MYFLKEQGVWIPRHAPSQILAAGFAEEIWIIWFLSQLHCWGYDDLSVTQCTVFQRPLHQACPLLLRRKGHSGTGCKSHPACAGHLGTCPFSSAAPRQVHTAHPVPFLLGHLTAPQPGGWAVRCWDLSSAYVPGSMLEFTPITIFNPPNKPRQVGKLLPILPMRKLTLKRG